MDVRDYEYIVAIAEQGSISRAAAQLFITQSALTKFLQRTEKLVGTPLFFRTGKRFQLTEAGQRYVETGRTILELDRSLMGQLQEQMATSKERIRLGYAMGRTEDILRNVLPAFYRQFPDIHVISKGDSSRNQMDALDRNLLDLVLVTNVERLPGYQYIPVETSRAVLAVHCDSPLPDLAEEIEGYPYPVLSREHLKDYPMVALPASTNSGNLMREVSRRYDLEFNVVLEVSDVRTLIDAVRMDYGAAFLMSVPLCSRKIRYLCLEGVDVEQTVMLVHRSDREMTPAMSCLIRLITDSPNHSTG